MELYIELFGTTASVIVAISLTMRNIKKLRIINSIGAFLFAVYGFVIAAWPVFGLNLFIFIINVYYLIQMANRHDAFDGFVANPREDDYIKHFLAYWKADIEKSAPSFFSSPIPQDAEAYVVLRDMVPVSLIVYRRRTDGDHDIILDYATPNYRDTKNSRFFFSWAAERFAKGPGRRFYAYTEIPSHAVYLDRMGFLTTGKHREDGLQEYVKVLPPRNDLA